MSVQRSKSKQAYSAKAKNNASVKPVNVLHGTSVRDRDIETAEIITPKMKEETLEGRTFVWPI